MKTGIEFIARERKEQIEKHYHAVEDDAAYNNHGQLRHAAVGLIEYPLNAPCPKLWHTKSWWHMCDKPLKERLIIAGALIAAEIDRLNYSEYKKSEP